MVAEPFERVGEVALQFGLVGVRVFFHLKTAAIFAPRGTPKSIITRLHQDILLALQHPRFNERMTAAGFDVVNENNRPEDLAKLVSDDIARWSKVAKAAGIKPDN